MRNGIDKPLARDTNRSGTTQLKRYEEMLVKNVMGTSRTNEPLQAVIENKLSDNALTETNNSILERNRALLQYVATIANSNSNTDEFNYEFVESLVKGGADINIADQCQQTIFHEVARSWNTDVTKFLLDLGCDINKQDCFGRSPLHVAAAVDYVDMTEFLLQNNANIDARTFGEDQAPIHYAAKAGAVKSLKMLLGFDADINSVDSKQRTSLQLAAEWTRGRTVEVLLQEGASSCLLNSSGNSALCVLIDRLPNFALEALNQLHTTDVITMKEFFYLQYLEASRVKEETKIIRTPLETAVTTEKFEVVTHPVMQRLIHNKWKQYGKFSTITDLLFHIVYAILWTAGCTGIPNTGKKIYEPFDANIWFKVVGAIIAVMTIYDIVMQIDTTIKSRKSQKSWLDWRTAELQDDMQYCHPRWPQEQKYINLEIKRVKALPLLNTLGAWFYLEWIVLILIIATTVTSVVYYKEDNTATRYVFTRTISIVNLLVWLRLLKYVRPFPGIGTLVIILGETMSDFVNWAFLYFLLLIPFTAAFWINFGAISPHPVHGYEENTKLLYTVFQMAIGDNFNLDGIVRADPVMARILVALYVTAMAIVTLNLLIALLSDTFSRVYGNALANTIMQRAIKVVNAERSLSKKGNMKYREYMRINCSPESLDKRVQIRNLSSTEKITEEIQHQLLQMRDLLSDRFGTVYGKNKTSDFDAIYQDLKKLKILQDEMSSDIIKIQEMLNKYPGKKLTFNERVSQKRSSDEKDQQRAKRTSTKKKEESNDNEESKSLVSTLQEAASSFLNRLMTRDEDEQSITSSKSKDKKGSSRRSRSESGDRSRHARRRRRREERDNDDQDTSSTSRRERRSRTPKDTGESSSTNDLALVVHDPRRARTIGYQNEAIQEEESGWDNISIDSTNL